MKGGASDSSDSEGGSTGHARLSRRSSETPIESPVKRQPSINGEVTTNSGGTSLFSGSIKSQHVAEQVKKMDLDLKLKLSNNFTSVRKAFLELDEEHNGYIMPEHLAKFLGASRRGNFDFTLLEILVKMQTKGLKTKITYNDFCAWFGNSIEPKEGFFFRHDSKKNP